jgi:hypothetical protein
LSDNLKIRFIASPRGNYHMTELLAGVCGAARDAGYDAQLESSVFPPPDEHTAYVVIPHEHCVCEPPSAWPSLEQRRRTIALCVENPPSPWFEKVCELAPRFSRMLAINRSSLDELKRRRIPAEHLQLGYTSHWDRWGGEEGPRPIEVTYLGSEEARRDAIIAGYGRWLWHRRTAMLVPRMTSKPSARPDYLVDGAKYEHLRRSNVLVNLHRDGTRSFEWVRVLQAIANGCVVVSEPSRDNAPLIAGEHFLVAAADSIPHIVEGLLREPQRLEAIRAAAYETVKEELNMATTVEQLVAVAHELTADGRSASLAAVPRPIQPASSDSNYRAPADRPRVPIALHKLAIDTLDLRRSMQRLLERSEGRDPDAEPEVFAITPAYSDACPRVSVTITLHNYEHEVLDALASVDASEFEDYEVIVFDDASTDGSLAAVRDFFLDRPWMPAALLHHRVNQGLAASRNALARHARGELMFVMDADNVIYPTALGRLVEALDADPGATFAYPLIATIHSDQPIGLVSRYAWDPEGFHAGNYIDAMAMIRLDDFVALGGYTEDIRMTGWEDFHLWCGCADTGRRGTLVPEVLARYRKSGHSMVSSQTDMTAAWSLLHARFPAVVPSTQPE